MEDFIVKSSTHYPYLEVEVITEKESFQVKAYVDTGCVFGLLLPSKYRSRLGPRTAFGHGELADGTRTPLDFYRGLLKFGGRTHKSEIGCLLEDHGMAEPLLGRDVLDKFIVTFNGPAKRLTLTR